MFTNKETAYYADTDAYGVVWHGTYLRWLEKARSLYCENRGISLLQLEQQNLVFPVIELKIKYQKAVKLHDQVTINTSFKRLSRLKLAFTQKIILSNQICTEALVIVTVTHRNGQLCRPMPDIIETLFD